MAHSRSPPSNGNAGLGEWIMRRMNLVKWHLSISVALPLLILSAPANSNPGGEGGCPAGFEYISLEEVLSVGPRPSAILADETGNGDGCVCRRSLGQSVANSFPNAVNEFFYYWLDNDEPHGGK